MTAPLVSIVIPSYNAAEWIGSTIESVVRQTWSSIETIVVDDGSTDDSVAIARAFESRGVRVLTQPNRGAAAARNAGLRVARGAYVQHLDADDLIAPDKIEVQVRQLEGHPAKIASGSWARFSTSIDDAIFASEPVWADLSPADWLVRSWSGGGMMHPAAWLVPRDVVAKAGPWNEQLSLNDDGEYFARVILASQGVTFCGDARSFYRSRPHSLSASTSRAAWGSAWRSWTLSTAHLLAAADTPAARRACADAFQRLAFDVYPHEPALADLAEQRVESLGGSDLRADGGAAFRWIAGVAGWRVAARARDLRQAAGGRGQ